MTISLLTLESSDDDEEIEEVKLSLSKESRSDELDFSGVLRVNFFSSLTLESSDDDDLDDELDDTEDLVEEQAKEDGLADLLLEIEEVKLSLFNEDRSDDLDFSG